MRPVVRYTLKQVVFMNLVFVLLIVSGIYSLFTTPVENMPPVDIGRVFIRTVYYGASAQDVENLVTSELEDALDGMENIEYIQARSLRNVSILDVKFIDDMDYEALYDELRFRVLNVRNELPAEVDDPVFVYLDTQAWMPVITLNLVGEMPHRSLKLLGEELKQNLLSIEGAREVIIEGEYEDEFHVSLDPELLRSKGVTFEEVGSALASANTKLPTGRFSTGEREFFLDAGRRFDSQEELLGTVLRRDGDGTFVRLRDVVTTARMSHRKPDIIYSVDGSDTLMLLVKKEDKGNAVDIATEAKRIARSFVETHPAEGIDVKVTWDSTVEVHSSTRILGGNLLLGMFLVTIVLWVTLGFRNAMLTAIGIPFSFLATTVIMKLTGLSINTISLFSFVLVSGIIVDDAVIVLENVYRHLQMGKERRQAIVDGVGEVMLPVISSALTTILAFVPMLIMTGSTGEFFSVIPKTVSYALAASLLEALFILPIHIFDWGPKRPPHSVVEGRREEGPMNHLQSGLFAPLWRLYHWILERLLARPLKTILVMTLAFVAAVAILALSITGVLPLIKVEFFPGSSFRYHASLTLPRGIALETTDRMIRDYSEFLMSFGAETAAASVGQAGFSENEDYSTNYGHHFGQVVITLPDQDDWNFPENPENDLDRHMEFIRSESREFFSEKKKEFGFTPQLNIYLENTGPPSGKPVNVRVSGDTMASALRAADALRAYISNEPEFRDLTELEDNRPRYQSAVHYLPDEEAASEHGLSPGAITAIVAGALNGRRAGQFRAADEEVDLMVRLARPNDPGNTTGAGISSPEEIMELPVIEHPAAPVFLRDVANLNYVREPDIRTRYNGKPTITIKADILPASKLSASRVQNLLSGQFREISPDHPGVTLSYGGEFEATSRAYTSLTFAFIIAVLGIYLVLSSQFRDYFQPLIILSAIAFAVIGVVYGMFFTRSIFTIGSFLAAVGLAGVAVNDSLILIDFINHRRREGMKVREAVLDGASARMRPVLITTVTTMLGLLPMAIGIPRKSIAWAPMATAFVTGLASATILTLLIVPVEYELVERLRCRLRKLTGLGPGEGTAEEEDGYRYSHCEEREKDEREL